MLLGHADQVFRDGRLGLLQSLHQVSGILVLIRAYEGDGCALVACPACSNDTVMRSEKSTALGIIAVSLEPLQCFNALARC